MLEEIERSSLALEQSKSTSLKLGNDIALFHLCSVLEENAEVNVSACKLKNALCNFNSAHDSLVLCNVICRACVLLGNEVVCRRVNVVDVLHERGRDDIIYVTL